MGRARSAGNPATGSFDVIGVDVQSHRAVALRAGIGGTAGAQGFGQHHAHAAVQQAVGLDGILYASAQHPHHACIAVFESGIDQLSKRSSQRLVKVGTDRLLQVLQTAIWRSGVRWNMTLAPLTIAVPMPGQDISQYLAYLLASANRRIPQVLFQQFPLYSLFIQPCSSAIDQPQRRQP